MSDGFLALIVLGMVSLGFIFQRLPLYVTALSGALALAFLGIIPMSEVYGSLANPTLVPFAGMFALFMKPGGYRFADYLKVGSGLTLVCLAVAGPVILLRWPFFP